ncbi:MAG: response regulator [Proteobacteria bacterium]|nr:response regulator [Pseudomonadota bacterium]
MTNNDTLCADERELRRRAEEIALQNAAQLPENKGPMSVEETRLVLHELRVHQIELEMQNEELRRAQFELDSARAQYFDFYDLAPVGYCTISKEGVLLKANLTTARLLDIDRKTLVGQTVYPYIHKEDQDRYYLFFKSLLKTGEVTSCELRMVKRGGAIFWAHVLAMTVPDPSASSGQDAGGAGVCRFVISDVTECKQAEDEREKLAAQLQQAQKMESVGLLAGGVAHDFNNKLTIILGYTEMLLGKVAPTEPLFADLQEIQQAAKHSADLTRQLLAFARKQVVTPKILELNDMVDGMLNMLRRLIGENIDLLWRPVSGLWQVKIDPSQIDQILANLCVNARHAIAGVGRLTIQTANIVLDSDYCSDHIGSVPGEYVHLTVSDDGCGMNEETLARIFEPFFTTKAFGEGTGLGLATVYGAVKQNNGFIYVESRPGSGTTFNIYLPRHRSITLQVPQEVAAEPIEGGRETILLVEDEGAILKMATIMLQNLGYTVLATNSPVEAIRLAKVHTGAISLLMTDVVMPEMNGRDLEEHLASFIPQLKCLFMSGYTADIISRQGKLDPDLHFIQKPFSASDLAAKVRKALEG